MTRFWHRTKRSILLFSSSKNEKPTTEKKSLPTITPENYSFQQPSCLLKESELYQHYLVDTDAIETVYSSLVQQITRNKLHNLFNKSDQHWKCIDSFVQAWYHELETVSQHGLHAFKLLEQQLEKLTTSVNDICCLQKQKNRSSIKQLHQFISFCIKEWEMHPSRSTVTTVHHHRLQKSTLHLEDNSTCSIRLFSEILLNHQAQSMQQDVLFLKYQHKIQHRLKSILSDTTDTNLTTCITTIQQFDRHLYLFQHYISSQFQLLSQLLQLFSSFTSSSAFTSAHGQDTHILLQVLTVRHKQKRASLITLFLQLQTNLHTLYQTTTSSHPYTCPICLSLLRRPTEISLCGHVFCNSCLQHLYCRACFLKSCRKSATALRLSKSVLSRVSFMASKITPSPVMCECSEIDTMTGEIVPKRRKGACPLCRVQFKPNECRVDSALEKVMESLFKKQRGEEEYEERRDEKAARQEEEKKKQKKLLKKEGCDVGHGQARVSEGTSSVNTVMRFKRVQRWSQKLLSGEEDDSGEDMPITSTFYNTRQDRRRVPTTTNVEVGSSGYESLLMARRSWMF